MRKMRGSDRLVIVDDAHKLTQRGLQCLMDFHDETHSPVAMVGTFELIDKLERDAQLFSRVGLKWVIGQTRPKELIDHIIHSLVPNANGHSEELAALCEQVASQAGHFRAVHKQLKLAVEMLETSSTYKNIVAAFRGAHSKMCRNYKLA